jgi:deglycase
MRIACLIDKDFEDSEFTKPYDALRSAGHEVEIIGFDGGRELRGKRGEATTTTTKGIADARPDQYDALLIPGGYSPDHLRGDSRMVQFTKAFFDKPRPVFAICHGPQLLLTAGLVRGRTMTAWKTVQDDLRLAGANVVDQEVVVDRELVTSRQPSDLDAFSREALRVFERTPAEAR